MHSEGKVAIKNAVVVVDSVAVTWSGLGPDDKSRVQPGLGLRVSREYVCRVCVCPTEATLELPEVVRLTVVPLEKNA